MRKRTNNESTMKKINRKQAEILISHTGLKDSQSKQVENDLCVKLILTDGQVLMMRYDVRNKAKRYFLV